MPIFLLELRTEEIPANALAGAREQLRSGFHDRLVAAGIEGCEVRALSTSRRLIVQLAGLPDRQPDRSERVTGPPRTAAFTDDGAPTRAAEGFARKLGLQLDQLELERTSKGEYLAATVVHEGSPTAEILAAAAAEVIAGLRFPKMMRWGLGEHEFVRPVHGVAALLDDRLVPLELFGIRSGDETEGHRVHCPETFRLEHADQYQESLESRQVVVDPERRREAFATCAHELVAELGCRVHPDEALVSEHVELVEYPGLLLGSFDARFLDLPREVVVTTLRHHQKCLVLERPNGELAPYFLAVVDRRDDPEGLVRQGNEWVISARLADARFFFDEDRKRRLSELVPELERLEFHRTLGSMAAKVDRVGDLAVALAEEAGIDLDPMVLRRAAGLVKADLLTHMVGEFPELQGIVGGHYLRLEGESEELWTATRDHYLPHGFDGELPVSELGRMVGVADRLDTLVGLFAAGEIPSGSRDPYGLRRAAQGMVRVAAESEWEIDVSQAIERAVELVREVSGVEGSATRDAVEGFVAERVRRYLEQVVGVAYDTAAAVMAAGWSRLPGLVARARALESERASPAFRSLSLAFKRVLNITEGEPDGEVDSGLFEHPEEGQLYRSAGDFHDRLQECLTGRRFAEAFAAMAELAGVLDRFFVEVLVMADDDRVRSNRIALLRSLRRDFLRLADLSKLQVEGGDG